MVRINGAIRIPGERTTLTAFAIIVNETQNRTSVAVDWVHIFTPRLFVESNYSYEVFTAGHQHQLSGRRKTDGCRALCSPCYE